MSSDVHDFIDAGLYDPDDPGAEARLALLQFLTDEVGASIPEIVQALEEEALVSMAAFRALRPAGERVTLRETAERAGVRRRLRAARVAGGRVPRPAPVRTPLRRGRRRAARPVPRTRDFVGEEPTLQLVRTLGTASAQIAEAEIAMVRSNMEAPLIADGHFVDVARSYRTLWQSCPRGWSTRSTRCTATTSKRSDAATRARARRARTSCRSRSASPTSAATPASRPGSIPSNSGSCSTGSRRRRATSSRPPVRTS